jgi:hypothetical protein
MVAKETGPSLMMYDIAKDDPNTGTTHIYIYVDKQIAARKSRAGPRLVFSQNI